MTIRTIRTLRRRVLALAGRWPWTSALVHRAARRLAAPQRVGVVAVVPDDAGRVLAVRHAFRDPRWSLPGGWVRLHEQPADALVRELREELGLVVVPVGVLDAESHREGVRPRFPTPSAMTIAYLCAPVPAGATPVPSPEVTAVAWLDAAGVAGEMTPFDAAAVREARRRLADRPAP